MKKFTGSFRYTQWDPWLISSQIISVQCIMYLTLGLLLSLLGVLIGDARTMDHVFEYHVCNILFPFYLLAFNLLTIISTAELSCHWFNAHIKTSISMLLSRLLCF